MQPEDDAIVALERNHPSLSQPAIQEIVSFFYGLRQIEEMIARTSSRDLYEGQWALLGIISHAYQLMLCSVYQLSQNNRSGFFVAARGLIESACSITWANRNRARLPSLVAARGPTVGRLLNAGYCVHPQLKKLYSEFSNVAHPGRGSHLLGFRHPTESKSRSFMSSFSLNVPHQSVARWLDCLIVIGQVISVELQPACSDRDAVMTGRIMATVVSREAQ